jgi:hypothetical protein
LQKTLDIEKVVFIDETWTKTNMTPSHGRAERGKRVIEHVPHGHCHVIDAGRQRLLVRCGMMV